LIFLFRQKFIIPERILADYRGGAFARWETLWAWGLQGGEVGAVGQKDVVGHQSLLISHQVIKWAILRWRLWKAVVPRTSPLPRVCRVASRPYEQTPGAAVPSGTVPEPGMNRPPRYPRTQFLK